MSISEASRQENGAVGSVHAGYRTKLSLVVPAYNEAARLGAGLPRLLEAVPWDETQIIVVDDGSTDGTAEVARWHLAGLPHAAVLRLPKNSGKGAAVRAGVVKAEGEIIGYMDADMATDPRDLVLLVERLAGSEVAVGSRTSPGSVIDHWSTHRKIMTRTFSLLVTGALNLPMRDTQCGFKLFHGPVAKLLFHGCHVDGFAFDLDILSRAARLGLDMAEVPVHWSEIPGSKVRVVHDSLAMLVDVGRTIVAHHDEAPIHGVATFASDPWHAAQQLRSSVRVTDPVLAWEGGAAALFPCTPPTVSARLARQLRDELPFCRLQEVELRFDALCVHSAPPNGPGPAADPGLASPGGRGLRTRLRPWAADHPSVGRFVTEPVEEAPEEGEQMDTELKDVAIDTDGATPPPGRLWQQARQPVKRTGRPTAPTDPRAPRARSVGRRRGHADRPPAATADVGARRWPRVHPIP